MAWTIRLIRSAEKDLARIDRVSQVRIRNYLNREISPLPNPRTRGKGLTGELSGLWRYRVGDYRLLCDIQDSVKVIMVVKVGHRSKAYDS